MNWTDRVPDKASNQYGTGQPPVTSITPAPAETKDKEHEKAPEAAHGSIFKKVATVALVSAVAVGGFAYLKGKNPFNVSGKALTAAEFVAKGFHAIPKHNKDNPLKNFPSAHRLLNVVGMVTGFASAQYLSNIIFGCKINGSNCEEIPKEKVPAPLRFLHGIVEYNPFSDAPRDEWLKVLHQMIPAVAGAVGAVKGSEVFFKFHNGREKDFVRNLAKTSLSPLEENSVTSFAQGKIWRNLAGATAWFSSASGLTVLYGLALNNAFLLCNDAKTMAGAAEITGAKFLRKFSNTTSELPHGPEKALQDMLRSTEKALRDSTNPAIGEKAGEEYAKRLVGSVFEPMIKDSTPQERDALVQHFKMMFETGAMECQASGLTPEEFTQKMKAETLKQLASTEVQHMGHGMVAGQNGWIGELADNLGARKMLRKLQEQAQKGHLRGAPVLGRA